MMPSVSYQARILAILGTPNRGVKEPFLTAGAQIPSREPALAKAIFEPTKFGENVRAIGVWGHSDCGPQGRLGGA